MSDDKANIPDAALQMREAHFPGRAPIDAYGNGGFRFADMSHVGSLICLPSGIYGWNVDESTELSIDMFSKVLEEVAELEVFLLGTGQDIRMMPKELKEALRSNQVSSDPMSTGAAVRTYNVLLAESRAVGAAFIAV
ncbi:MAG: Mth938-like domain-containing protein [Lentilitoribacter sp.]